MFKKITIPDFSGGLNTKSIPANIADNEMSDMMNMELDDTGSSIYTRFGSEELFRVPDLPTSTYGFKRAGEDEWQLLVSTQQKVYMSDPSTPNSYSDITGGVTISGDIIQWKTMNNLAIGASRYTGTYNPIKYSGTGNIAQLAAAAPKMQYIEVWNSRLFGVGAATSGRNTVHYSALGSCTDWTTTGISGFGSFIVDYDDGDEITGLVAFAERLFIFKRNRIYHIITANPNTDPTKWRKEIITSEGGCNSAYSIVSFHGDVIFSSDQGYVSLASVLQSGDFKRSIISRKINTISNTNRRNYPVVVRRDKEELWMAAELGINDVYGSGNGVLENILVLSFDQNSNPRWTRHKFFNRIQIPSIPQYGPTLQQPMLIQCMGNMEYDGAPYIIFAEGFGLLDANGAATGDYGVYRFPNTASTYSQRFCDAWMAGQTTGIIYSYATTKSFDFGSPMIGKKSGYLGVQFKSASESDSYINVTYSHNDSAIPNEYGSYKLNVDADFNDHVAWTRLNGFTSVIGRKFYSIKFKISSIVAGFGFMLKSMTLEGKLLSRRQIRPLATQQSDTPIA